MAHPQLDRIMDNARVHLPGALDTAIQYELFNTLDEFCRGSLVWKEEIPVEVDTDNLTYDVIPTSGTTTQLISLENADGTPVKGYMEVPELLVLASLPSVAETLTATVGLTVIDPVKNDGNPEVPDWILMKYLGAITDGLLGRMHSQPAKPYTNEKLAVYHSRRFRDRIALARTDAMHMNQYGAQRWRFPKFA